MSESSQSSFEDLSIIGSSCSNECNYVKRIQTLETEKEQINKTLEKILLKIDSVEETNASLKFKVTELTSELEKLRKENDKKVHFVKLSNSISNYKLSKFVHLDDGKVKYQHVEGEDDHWAGVYPINSFCDFKRAIHLCSDFSLFYFEMTMIMEEIKANEDYYACIGINNSIAKILLCNDEKTNWKSNGKIIKKFSWNDKDVFGCGLVVPPRKDLNTLPYVFFTKNGNIIVDKIVIENKIGLLPEFILLRCSIEPNFGNNLTTKPFSYNIYEYTI